MKNEIQSVTAKLADYNFFNSVLSYSFSFLGVKKFSNSAGPKEVSLFHVYTHFLHNFYYRECCSKNSQSYL